VVVSVGAQSSPALGGASGFSYDAPVIDSISVPGGGAVTQGTVFRYLHHFIAAGYTEALCRLQLSGGTRITVRGTSFGTGGSVSIGGSACILASRIDHTEIQCFVPPIPIGSTSCVVTVDTQSSAAFPFSYRCVQCLSGG